MSDKPAAETPERVVERAREAARWFRLLADERRAEQSPLFVEPTMDHCKMQLYVDAIDALVELVQKGDQP